MNPSTPVFSGRKFSVIQTARRGRDGVERSFEFVQHPGAAVILPILPDGRVLLIANERDAVGETLLEAPAGTLDDNEPPEHCAARELEEETGHRARRLAPLCAFFSSPGICTERLHAFAAFDLTETQAALEPDERITLRPMTLDAALAAIQSGEIRDGKTIVALLYYDRFLRAEN